MKINDLQTANQCLSLWNVYHQTTLFKRYFFKIFKTKLIYHDMWI